MRSLFSLIIFSLSIFSVFFFSTSTQAQSSTQKPDSASSIFFIEPQKTKTKELLLPPLPLELNKNPQIDWKKENWRKVREWEKFHPFVLSKSTKRRLV